MKSNSKIEDLLKEYESEGCDFSDLESVIENSLRNVETISDSHVRCLLYTLANHCKVNESIDIWTYRIHLIIAWICGIMLVLGLQF